MSAARESIAVVTLQRMVVPETRVVSELQHHGRRCHGVLDDFVLDEFRLQSQRTAAPSIFGGRAEQASGDCELLLDSPYAA